MYLYASKNKKASVKNIWQCVFISDIHCTMITIPDMTYRYNSFMLFHTTVYAEIFVGEIFHGLNFCGVKFSWLKPPTKICCHEIFATLTVCAIERWLLSSEKSYVYVDTMFTTTYGKLLLENAGLRERAKERS